MNKKALTLTIVANMTSNYGEGLGNISSVQKIFKNGQTFSIRSKESLKNRIMVTSGFYDDLKVVVSGAAQMDVSEELNASNCRALEGGYLHTGKGKAPKKNDKAKKEIKEEETKSENKMTYKRNSSIYLTDAISCEPFINETRFHNNLHLATTYAKQNNINVQVNASECGLMPYQYEFEKAKKIYSLTIDLESIGKDENFNKECDNKEKAQRVITLLKAVKNLNLIVKENNDDAQPLFIVGGLSERKTHCFENIVKVKNNKLVLSESLKDYQTDGFKCGLLKAENFENESEITKTLNPLSINEFFSELEKEVNSYYGL